MQLFVDDQPHAAPPSGPFRDVLESVRREAAAEGRAIMAIFQDGRELTVEEEEVLRNSQVTELARVDLKTTPAREWGLHGMGEVASAFGQIGDSFHACGELFRQNRMSDGLDRANEGISLFLQVLQALNTSVGLAGVSPTQKLRTGIDSVVSAMRELEGAVRSSDSVAAADIVEYQLPETLEALAGEVRAMAAARKNG